MIGGVGFAFVQVVVQAVDFAYLGNLEARLGMKFFGDEYLVEDFERALVDVGVNHIAHRVVTRLDACGIEKLAVKKSFAKAAAAGDDLTGDGFGIVVEITCDDARDAVAFEQLVEVAAQGNSVGATTHE